MNTETKENYSKEEILLYGFQYRVEEWRHMFDTPPNIRLAFTLDSTGMLRLNGLALCPILHFDSINSMQYDAECMWLVTNTGAIFEICFEWPYEDNPYIASIFKREELFCGTDDD